MNRIAVGALLAAAGLAIGVLVAAPPTVASDNKAKVGPPPAKGGEAPKVEAPKAAPQEPKPGDVADPKPQPPPKGCEPAPCAPGPCACPASGSDVAIAALFVIAILGTVIAVGRLAHPAAHADKELTDLRELVKNQLAREQEQNQAARAWGLQAFETMARASGFAEPSAHAVFGVQPPTGPAQAQVRIFGRGFELDSRVLVGGIPATDVVFISPTELTAKVPPGPKGAKATVTVVWPTGRAAYLEAAFAYA